MYDSWTGAGLVGARKLFNTETKKPLDLEDFPEIQQYLPGDSATGQVHFCVGRVATTSKKTRNLDVVKLFVSSPPWNEDFATQLSGMEFTHVEHNLNRLKSDVPLQLRAGRFKVDYRIEIFRDLETAGYRPTAKIVFRNETSITISAFWCW